jgi:hypothetical protein
VTPAAGDARNVESRQAGYLDVQKQDVGLMCLEGADRLDAVLGLRLDLHFGPKLRERVLELAAQERLDPPIGIVEYAQIVVALERGNVGKVLGELDLELSDLMRLQRVWSRRVASSPEVNNSLNAAIEAMRRE